MQAVLSVVLGEESRECIRSTRPAVGKTFETTTEGWLKSTGDPPDRGGALRPEEGTVHLGPCSSRVVEYPYPTGRVDEGNGEPVTRPTQALWGLRCLAFQQSKN